MINVIPGKFPHVGWVDLEGNGIAIEIAIMKNDVSGLYFIRLDQLDRIDKQRLFRVINNRNANMYELWDLMSNVTLGNGENALSYFHQLVRVLTASGKIMKPIEGQRGLGENFRRIQQQNTVQPEVQKTEEPAILSEPTKKVVKRTPVKKTPVRRRTTKK